MKWKVIIFLSVTGILVQHHRAVIPGQLILWNNTQSRVQR